MKNYYKDLERQLNEVLTAAKKLFPDCTFELASDFVFHGEYGLALETIVSIIEEDDKHANFELFNKIVKVGKQMELEESTWEAIRPIP